MNLKEADLKEELSHLDATIDIIEEVIEEKTRSIEESKKNIIEHKRDLWQSTNDYSSEELNSLKDNEDFQVSLINKDIDKLYKLYKSKERPYFSRVDFENKGKVESFYIGLTGVLKEYEPIVYDWRASVSNLYYNYGIGPSEYTEGDTKYTGNTLLKRQFDIKMGVLSSIFDSTVDVVDPLLEDALSSNTSRQMKNIVSSIQREQNEIIRSQLGRSVIVSGAAGSGKTSIAMHRIAYLLYNQKELNSKNVLIFSPSDTFSNYISDVMPSLGEENVLTTTFKEFSESYIPGYKCPSLTDFIAKYYEDANYEESVALKFKDEYKKMLDEFLYDYYDRITFTKKFGLKKKFLLKKELDDMKRSIPKNLSFYDRILRLAEKICESFGIDSTKNAQKMHDVLEDALKIEKDPVKLYSIFLNRDVSEVNYEDITPILYLYFEVHGYPSMAHIKHVVVDEAQDYSMWQFLLLRKIFSSASFTILGDKNQAINPYLKYEDLSVLKEIFSGAIYKELTNTYRSSAEIIDYSNKILGLTGIKSIRKYNNIDCIKRVEKDLKGELISDIELLKAQKLDYIAIITKTREEASKIANIVGDEVEVLPVYEAKGLEYDAVIIYTDPMSPYGNIDANLFYVAATRALHALIVYNQKI